MGQLRFRFTIRWMMGRVAIAAFPFLVLAHVRSWDMGPLIVLLPTYVGMEVALRPYRDASECECGL
jgi:hypothetical protein